MGEYKAYLTRKKKGIVRPGELSQSSTRGRRNRNKRRLKTARAAPWDGEVGSVMISWAIDVIWDHLSPVLTNVEAQTQPPTSLLRVEAHCSDSEQ